MTAISGVGPHMPDHPGGLLYFQYLPEHLQALEDARAMADRTESETRRAQWSRLATDTERELLTHLGYELPDVLRTVIGEVGGIRCRTWPALL